MSPEAGNLPFVIPAICCTPRWRWEPRRRPSARDRSRRRGWRPERRGRPGRRRVRGASDGRWTWAFLSRRGQGSLGRFRPRRQFARRRPRKGLFPHHQRGRGGDGHRPEEDAQHRDGQEGHGGQAEPGRLPPVTFGEMGLVAPGAGQPAREPSRRAEDPQEAGPGRRGPGAPARTTVGSPGPSRPGCSSTGISSASSTTQYQAQAAPSERVSQWPTPGSISTTKKTGARPMATTAAWRTAFTVSRTSSRA